MLSYFALVIAGLAIGAGPAPDPTPDFVWGLALGDATTNLPSSRHRVTRYASLHPYPVAVRPRIVQALTFATNSTSFRGTFAKPVVVAGPDGVPLLVRLDLESLAWDRGSRTARLAELEKRGIDYGFKDAEARRLFVDPWELFARDDPYFLATQVYGGKAYKGWLDPAKELAARHLSFSTKFVVRADWLLGRLLTEKDFGGYYSTLLMLPAKEDQLYKVFGVDIKLVQRDNLLRRGGAVLSSIVALRNRELQQIPSLYGHDDRFIWLTFDVNVDARGEKSVLEAFAGTLKHDGREIIGTLPNGTHWYFLADGAGKQVAVVPESIAQIKAPILPVKETRVVSAYKCLECHGVGGGINSFDDVVSAAALNPKVELAVIAAAHAKDKAAATRELLEDYYLSGLSRTITRQQASYTERLKECCGMTGLEMASVVVSAIEDYTHDLVDPIQAARDMGLTLTAAEAAWRVSGNSALVVLSGGQPIRRGSWEQGGYKDAMQAVTWPWETH